MRQHVLDISKTMVASIAATAVDGVFFALLTTFDVMPTDNAVGMAATLAAIFGGVVHYLLCTFWVFERFEQSHFSGVPLYIAMSGMAAVLHGLATQGLSIWMPAGVAWGISKVLLFLLWTYPLSRYAVFGRASDAATTSTTED